MRVWNVNLNESIKKLRSFDRCFLVSFMRLTGIEPARVFPPEPKSGASASSATAAVSRLARTYIFTTVPLVFQGVFPLCGRRTPRRPTQAPRYSLVRPLCGRHTPPPPHASAPAGSGLRSLRTCKQNGCVLPVFDAAGAHVTSCHGTPAPCVHAWRPLSTFVLPTGSKETTIRLRVRLHVAARVARDATCQIRKNPYNT